MTKSDFLAVILCVGVVFVIASITTALVRGDGPGDVHTPPTASLSTRSMLDSAQARQIHAALLAFAGTYGNRYPVPGEIKRLPVVKDGVLQRIPNMGDEDISQNTTANLYSFLVMRRYLPTRVLVSPIERNENVSVKRDYDFDCYDPHESIYWDGSFAANLQETSHASYAHMPIFGKRRDAQWGRTRDASFAILGNRGPHGGKPDPSSVTCDPHGLWSGHVVYNDNHFRLHRTTTPGNLSFKRNGEERPDNLFAFDDGVEGVDAMLTFTISVDFDGPTVQHD